MKKFALVAAMVAGLAVSAAPAQADDGPVECAKGAVTAVKYILQGTPQPQECDLSSASTAAVGIPEINCGIVSCTYRIEQAIAAGTDLVEDVADCAVGTVAAYYRALQGYPQMYYCEIG